MILYHTGFQEIRAPDPHVGRANADFGQGFYLSDDIEFSKRWARERKGENTYLNAYEFSFDGLRIKRLSKDTEWFTYIFDNRSGRADAFSDYDVVIGPIANDTIYDTWGILTSGFLHPETALRVLQLGREYRQIVLKTEKAVSALHFQSAVILPHAQIAQYRDSVAEEEKAYQEQFGIIIGDMPDFV